jgi:DNA polymerase-3 subunit epsilon
MHERRRLALLCSLVWLVAVALLAGAVLRLADGNALPDDVVIVLLVAAFGIGAALALLWARIDLRVLRPVARLEREIDTILHAEPDRAFDLGAPGAIEALAGRVASLVARGDRARRELGAAVAATTERLEDERSRLAAVLRDLSEGVVLCDAQHRVLLFNDAARHALGAPAALGLGRKLSDAVADGNLAAQFDALRDAGPESRAPVEMVFNGKPARMAVVVEPDGAVIGYVLSFAASDLL